MEEIDESLDDSPDESATTRQTQPSIKLTRVPRDITQNVFQAAELSGGRMLRNPLLIYTEKGVMYIQSISTLSWVSLEEGELLVYCTVSQDSDGTELTPAEVLLTLDPSKRGGTLTLFSH